MERPNEALVDRIGTEPKLGQNRLRDEPRLPLGIQLSRSVQAVGDAHIVTGKINETEATNHLLDPGEQPWMPADSFGQSNGQPRAPRRHRASMGETTVVENVHRCLHGLLPGG